MGSIADSIKRLHLEAISKGKNPRGLIMDIETWLQFARDLELESAPIVYGGLNIYWVEGGYILELIY